VKLPVIIVSLGLSGALAAAWSTGAFDERAAAAAVPDDGLFDVARGDLRVTLTENGTLVAKDSRKVDSDMKGQAKITWLVEEGSEVAEGDVVARLDSTEQQEQLEQRELEIVQTEADVDTARTDLEIQQADNAAAIEKAELDKDKAQKEQERYVDGDAPKERRKLEVAIKAAETTFTRAKKRFEDSTLLQEKDYINKSQVEEDQIAYEQATVELESARRDLELFDVYTYPMTMTEKSVAVRDAERGLETASKRARSTERQKQVTVEQHEKRLTKLKDQAKDLTEEIAKMTLTAPSPGIVIYGDPRRPWNRDEIRVGGEVWGQMTLITIPDLRVMQVKLRVHEADISKLHEGQPATVSMDTYPGLVLSGKVTKIAGIASGDNEWDNDPEVKKFDVEVTLDQAADEALELKPGISAKAQIFIEERRGVLFVPLQCVFLDEGKHQVYRLDAGGRPEAVVIEPGMSNDSHIEVLSGLQPGDRVLLYNPDLGGSGSSRSQPASDEAADAADQSDASEDTGNGPGSDDGSDAGTATDEATGGATSGATSEATGGATDEATGGATSADSGDAAPAPAVDGGPAASG